MWQRAVPLVILLIIALMILVLVLWRRRQDREDENRDRRSAEAAWDNECKFDNPKTGATCERREFHLENHYHDVNGRLETWP